MMKKFLKSLSLVMALVMCFTMVFTAAVSADGATPSITFGVENSVEPGAVSIDVIAANFADVAGVQGEITVAGLDDAAVVAGTIDNVVIDAGVIAFAQEGNQVDGETKLTIADGTLFTITGTAVEGTNITLAWTAAETKACDIDEKLLDDLTYADKTVEVKKAVVGPTLDENITIAKSIVVYNTLGVLFDVANVQGVYETVDVVVTRSYYDTYTYNVLTETTTIEYDEANYWDGLYSPVLYGFALTDMCLDLTVQVVCSDANGNKFVSAVETTNIKTLATELYETTTDIKTKTVLTDLLNLGSDAQAYFASVYKNSDLAKVSVEDYPAYGFSQEYATAELGELTLGEGQISNNGAAITVAGTILQSPAVSFEVTPAVEVSENLTFEISYYDAFAGADVPVTYTSVAKDWWEGVCYYNFAELPLYSSNAVVSVTVFDGETELGACSYSVEHFVSENVNHSNALVANIANTIGRFGQSARAYFNLA